MNPALLRSFGGTAAPNVPAPAADLLAPSVIQRVVATPAVGSITVTAEQPCDIHDGVTAASGISAGSTVNVDSGHDLLINGSTSVALTRLSANIVAAPTLYNLFMGVSPSMTQNGLTFTLTAEGNGVGAYGTDECGLIHLATVTGDFTISCELGGMTGSDYIYAPHGIIAHANHTTQGALLATLAQCNSFDGKRLEDKRRITVDEYFDSANYASVPGNGSLRKIIWCRQGTTLTSYYTDNSGNYQSLRSAFSNLPNTIELSLFAYSGVDGVPCTSTFYNVCISNGARLSYLHTTTTPNQTYQIRSRDVNGNTSAYSQLITASPLTDPPPDDELVNHNPGFYVIWNSLVRRPVSAHDDWWFTYLPDFLDSIKPSFRPKVDGVELTLPWYAGEFAKGNYTELHLICDRINAACSARGLRWVLHTWDREFKNTGTGMPSVPQFDSGNRGVPDWLISEGLVGAYDDGSFNTVHALLWNSTAMDYFIDFNAEIGIYCDDMPWFEMLQPPETAGYSTVSGWTFSGFDTQWRRFANDVGAYFVNSAKTMHLNYYGFVSSQAQADGVVSFMDYCRARKWGISSPDLIPFPGVQGTTQGERITYGGTSFGYYWGPGLRGLCTIAHHNEVGAVVLSKEAVFTHSYENMRNTHLMWSYVTEFEASAEHWFEGASGVYAYIDAQPAIVYTTACPSDINGLCHTGGT